MDIQAYYYSKDGIHYIQLIIPRWLLDELEYKNISQASSSITGGAGKKAPATITLQFTKNQEPTE